MVDPIAQGLALAGGAIALLGGLIGSSLGIGVAGSSGVEVLAEDPKQLRNVIVLAALPMTQTFYGLIVLINFILYVNSHPDIDLTKGIALLALGAMVAAAEAYSAKKQGDICASGIAELPRTRGKITFNAIIMAVYVELLGILGMVFSFMALSLIG
ncbi:MAG: ATPase [Desulfurococcales archaeon]|nr:ATPase [Desulfurococcales archaeon]